MFEKTDFGRLLSIIVLCIVLIGFPFVVNVFTGNKTMVGDVSYYSTMMVNQYDAVGVYGFDLLNERQTSFNLFFFVMSILPDSWALFMIMPLVLGFLSVLIFYFILRELGFDDEQGISAILILIIAPTFLFAFTSFYFYSFSALLFLLFIWLLLKKNPLSVVVIAALFLSGFVAGIAALLSASLLMYFKRVSPKDFIAGVVSSLLVVFGAVFLIDYNPILLTDTAPFMLTGILDSFGAFNGYSLIVLVLASIGFFVTWKRDISRTIVYFVLLFFLVLSFLFTELRVIMIFPLSVMASFSFTYLFNKNWNVNKLKGITILLIICSLVFSTVLFLKNEIDMLDGSKFEAAQFLKTSDSGDVVLSSEENGFLIGGVANRVPFLDGNSYKYVDYDNKKNIVDSIFYERDLFKVENLLQEHGISYFFIDSDMLSGSVWNGPEEGVLFLLKNSDLFVKIFENDKVIIYRYIK